MSLRTKINGFREIWKFDNRVWLTVSKTLFREKLQVYRYKGHDILIDHAAGDANGARDVLTSQMYRRFLPKMRFEGPITILDLGASNGGFPLLLATSGIDLKKVVSVELNPRTYARLHFNLNRNLDCEIVALNAALCGERRYLEVSLGNGSVSDNIYGQNPDLDCKIYKIEGLTFDDLYNEYFCDEVVDICKIDVEGAEFEVFSHPTHIKLKNCRYLIMEIHEKGRRLASEILPEVERFGFVEQTPDAGADPTVHFFINSGYSQIGS